MIENEAPAAAGLGGPRRPAASSDPRPGAAPCRNSRCAPRRPAPRLDFSAPPIEVAPGPPPSGKLSRRLDMHGEFPPDAIPAPEMSLSVLSDLRPLGQIHESFIIAAGRDGLWIIDQHVAHERILFEQVLKQRAAGRVEMQRLLMPMILQLTPEQQIDYARIAEELHASGFETEPFEVVPAPADHVGLVAEPVGAVGKQDQIEILVRLDQLVDDEKRVVRRNVVVHGAVREEQLPLQVLREVLVGLGVVAVGAVGVLRRAAPGSRSPQSSSYSRWSWLPASEMPTLKKSG